MINYYEVNQKLNILGYIYKFRPHGNPHDILVGKIINLFRPHGNPHDILDGKIINLFFGRCGHKRGSRHLVLQWSRNHIYSVLSRKDL